MRPTFQPRLVKELPAPGGIERLVEEACKRLGYRTKQDRTWVAEELRLQFNYGGMDVACMESMEGRRVIAAGTPEEVGQELERLPPEERGKVTICCPAPWEALSVPTAFANEA